MSSHHLGPRSAVQFQWASVFDAWQLTRFRERRKAPCNTVCSHGISERQCGWAPCPIDLPRYSLELGWQIDSARDPAIQLVSTLITGTINALEQSDLVLGQHTSKN